MDLSEKLRAFVKQNFYAASKLDFGDDESFLDLGIIDSTGVLELVGYLETEFGIELADEELVPDNLDSIANLGRFLEKKLAAPA